MDLKILFLDNHLLVINKPPGILSQSDITGDEDILSYCKSYIKDKFNKPGKVYTGLVHRLDRPVSGVMVLARTSKAASRLSNQFRENSIKKFYLAIVEGKCKGEGVCRDYLQKQNQTTKIVKKEKQNSKYAELKWTGITDQDKNSLLDVEPKTGRPHQIRVQLAHIGFPILGDLRYGAQRSFDGKNLALHCYAIEIEHPVRKEKMKWLAKPPTSWRKYFANDCRIIINRG